MMIAPGDRRRRGNERSPGCPDLVARLESRYDDSGNRQAPDRQEGQKCVEPFGVSRSRLVRCQNPNLVNTMKTPISKSLTMVSRTVRALPVPLDKS